MDRPQTPQEAAHSFMRGIFESKDLAEAWPYVDPDLRLVMVQGWLLARPSLLEAVADRDSVAAALTAAKHPYWPTFATDVVELLHASFEDYRYAEWGVAEQTQPVALDLEAVLFVKTIGPFTEDLVASGIVLVMRHADDAWRVAAFGTDRVREPGWTSEWPWRPARS